jgi:hypothetical protein
MAPPRPSDIAAVGAIPRMLGIGDRLNRHVRQLGSVASGGAKPKLLDASGPGALPPCSGA